MKPDAKNPPNGPISEAKSARIIEWKRNGWTFTTGSFFSSLKSNANGRGTSKGLEARIVEFVIITLNVVN